MSTRVLCNPARTIPQKYFGAMTEWPLRKSSPGSMLHCSYTKSVRKQRATKLCNDRPKKVPQELLGPPTPRVSPWKNFGSAVWNLRSWCVEEFVWIFLWPISLEIEGRKSPENFAKISPRFSSVSLKMFSINFTCISLWGTIGIRDAPRNGSRQFRVIPS